MTRETAIACLIQFVGGMIAGSIVWLWGYRTGRKSQR